MLAVVHVDVPRTISERLAEYLLNVVGAGVGYFESGEGPSIRLTCDHVAGDAGLGAEHAHKVKTSRIAHTSLWLCSITTPRDAAHILAPRVVDDRVSGRGCGRVCSGVQRRGMTLCQDLERQLFSRLASDCPRSWVLEPGQSWTLRDIVATIRRVGDDSDRMIRIVLGGGSNRSVAEEVVIVALIPMLRHRCRLDRREIEEVLTELTIAVGEMARDGVPDTQRPLANLLLDRAWKAHRKAERRHHSYVPFDPLKLDFVPVCAVEAPDDAVLDRVALSEFRQRLASNPDANRSAVDSWNAALRLADMDHRTSSERSRWKYVRKELRRRATADLVA